MGYTDRVKVDTPCSCVVSGERPLELTGSCDGCVQAPGLGRAQLSVAAHHVCAQGHAAARHFHFVNCPTITEAYAELKQGQAPARKLRSIEHPIAACRSVSF